MIAEENKAVDELPEEFLKSRKVIHEEVNLIHTKNRRQDKINAISEKRIPDTKILFQKKLEKEVKFHGQYSPDEKIAQEISVIYMEVEADPKDTNISMSGHVYFLLKKEGEEKPVMQDFLMAHAPPKFSDEKLIYSTYMGPVTFFKKEDYDTVKDIVENHIELLKEAGM